MQGFALQPAPRRCSRTRACARRWPMPSTSSGPTRTCSTASTRAPRATSPIPSSPPPGLPEAERAGAPRAAARTRSAARCSPRTTSRRRPTARATSATACARRCALLKEAGWEVKGGKLVNDATGQPLAFEILLEQTPSSSASSLPFVQNLRAARHRGGVRTVDPAQYEKPQDDFDFDMIVAVSASRCRRATSSATSGVSQPPTRRAATTTSGSRTRSVDALIEQVIAAPDREEPGQPHAARSTACCCGATT